MGAERPAEHGAIGGKRPEVLMVSAMQIHSASAYALVRDAWTLGEERPLIMAGGSKAIFEPWDYFGLSEDGQVGADVVVTGEEYVLLELLERILAAQESPKRRCGRRSSGSAAAGLLEDIPGLVYRPDAPGGPPAVSGQHRHPAAGAGPRRTAAAVRRLRPVRAARTTGRRCPSIPSSASGSRATATWWPWSPRTAASSTAPTARSPATTNTPTASAGAERLVEEMSGIARHTGIAHFFGTDDNFFNDRPTVESMLTAMARGKVGNRTFRKAVYFATEATEFDVFKNQDLLPLARDAGMRALWFGIEDLTAELIKKGQSPEKTKTVFKLPAEAGHRPDADDDAPRRPAAVHVEGPLRADEPGGVPPPGGGDHLPDHDVDPVGGKPRLRGCLQQRRGPEVGRRKAGRGIPVRRQPPRGHRR